MPNMLARVSIVAASAALLGLSALAAAWQPATTPAPGAGQPEPRQGQPGGPRRQGPGQGQPPNLEGSMKQMNRSLNQLRDQLNDPAKREDNLRLIGEVQRGCVGAKSAKPDHALADAKDEASRAKILADFRANLITVMRKLLDAEEAIANGKPQVASAALDEIEKIREAQHQVLGVRE